MKILKFIKLLLPSKQAYLNQYEFKNGDKSITLQEMIHVAPEDVYESINEEIKSFIKENPEGRIYLEGVYGAVEDCKKLNKKMSQIMNIEVSDVPDNLFIKQIYHIISRVTGWQLQAKENYLKDVAESCMVKADMTYAEMLSHLKHIKPGKGKKTELSVDEKTLDMVIKMRLPGMLLRKLLLSVAANPNKAAESEIGDIMPIILDKRNAKLLEIIVANGDKDIFVTYGAAHSFGLKKDLQDLGYTCELKKKVKLG